MTQHPVLRTVPGWLAAARRRLALAPVSLAVLASWGAGAVWGAPAAAADPWLAPVPVVVADRFHPPEQPWLAGHRGADLLAAPGTVVRAAGEGRVSFAGPLAGRGVVVVTHGDLRTTYEPVTATVAVGDHVLAGAPLGLLQPTLAHCGGRSCLHWGLLRGATYLDPLALLGPTRVRLLPFSAAGPVPATAGVPVAGAPAAGGAAPAAGGGPPTTAATPLGQPATRQAARPAADRASAPLVLAMAGALAGGVALARRRRAPPRPPG